MAARARVLIADDHPGFVRALGRVLASECDVVGVVSDGSEVAGAAARLDPVVAVVDVHLPTISGLDACREILQTNPRAKVILMTATIDDALRDEAATAGAFGFFSKLMAANEMLAAIRDAWAQCTRLAPSLPLDD